jgi:pimeloyl-ACP methyl ester carboxylesterase
LAALLCAGLTMVCAATADAADCPKGFACSRVTVPLDRAGGVPGSVDLFVARHRASAGAGKPMLLALTGGPGQSAVPFAPQFAQDFAPLLKRYQLVVFDQRGTGASGVIDCPQLQAIPDDAPPEAGTAAVGACGRSLGARAGAYATAATVEDIDAVRAAVGADRVALYGVSYGTNVIQRYALAHPDRVDRVVLDSPVEPGGVDPLQPSTYVAAGRILNALHPGAAAANHRLVLRLGRHPLRGSVHTSTGGTRRAQLTSGELFGLLVAGDQSVFLRRQYPAAVAAANRGDAAPLLRMKAVAGVGGETQATDLSQGLYAATVCTDLRLPWAPGSDPASRRPLLDASFAALPPDAGWPFDRATVADVALSQICVPWPATATVPEDVPAAYPAVPALVLVGLGDVRTPLENARAVQARWPGAGVVTAAATGHDVLGSDESGCARRVVRRFLAGAAAGDGACRASNGLDEPVSRFPLRIASLPPTGGHGRAAKALSAALLTVQDARQVAVTIASSTGGPGRLGGLRGGTVRWAIARGDLVLRLRDYAYLPGVRVSGDVAGERMQLRVRGRVNGRVVAGGRGIAARLGGRNLLVRSAKG